MNFEICIVAFSDPPDTAIGSLLETFPVVNQNIAGIFLSHVLQCVCYKYLYVHQYVGIFYGYILNTNNMQIQK